jgi:hypothetical protein
MKSDDFHQRPAFRFEHIKHETGRFQGQETKCAAADIGRPSIWGLSMPTNMVLTPADEIISVPIQAGFN